MTRIAWDQVGERRYETGVDHGVLYIPDNTGSYDDGFPWNGLTAVTESPSGAEASPQYADNMKYLNLVSAEEFGATIEAFTYPDEFGQCDGTAQPEPGIYLGQQGRRSFGFSYRTLVGNDTEGTEHGYKIHLIYGALASPSEKANNTVNDSPEAVPFSWEVSTSPVGVGNIGGTEYKPTAHVVLDSTVLDATALGELEDILYGTPGADARMPLPGEVVALFSGTLTEATPVQPAYNDATDTITIPTTTGVDYMINDNVVVAGPVVITEDTVVTARPKPGFVFPDVIDTDWYYNQTP
jgi:hypothetical protein